MAITVAYSEGKNVVSVLVDAYCTLFAHSVMQKIRLNSEINSAIRKKTSSYLTTDVLNKSFKSTVKHLIELDKAYSLMDSIIGRPVYWKKLLQEAFAMVKQLGIPTFFMVLSCTDLR